MRRGVAREGVENGGEYQTQNDATKVDDQHESISGRLVGAYGDKLVNEQTCTGQRRRSKSATSKTVPKVNGKLSIDSIGKDV